MNVTALEKRIFDRLEENPAAPTSFTEPEALAALNHAYFLFVFLTLCLEKTVTFTVTAATPFFGIRGTLTDYLLPLRLTIGGVRIRPSTLADLDAVDYGWQAHAGAPSRYATQGINLVAITPQPAIDTDSLFTYAYIPVALVAGSDVPAIPEEFHESLVKFALVRMRLKEGGNEFQKVLPGLKDFLGDAAKLGNFVRARSIGRKYDTVPFELKAADLSRLMKSLGGKGVSDGQPATG